MKSYNFRMKPKDDRFNDCGKQYVLDDKTHCYITETGNESCFLKVLIPESEEMALCETGEACFVRVSPEVLQAFEQQEEDTVYSGILDNDSCSFEALKHGIRIPFVMKGEARPLVPWEWIVSFCKSENR